MVLNATKFTLKDHMSFHFKGSVVDMVETPCHRVILPPLANSVANGGAIQFSC